MIPTCNRTENHFSETSLWHQNFPAFWETCTEQKAWTATDSLGNPRRVLCFLSFLTSHWYSPWDWGSVLGELGKSHCPYARYVLMKVVLRNLAVLYSWPPSVGNVLVNEQTNIICWHWILQQSLFINTRLTSGTKIHTFPWSLAEITDFLKATYRY